MTILITGGFGYIGSHIAISLIKLDYDIVIVDKNYNDKIVDSIKRLSDGFFSYEICDLINLKKLNKIFTYYNITHVIHLAAYKSVPESVNDPLLYYTNNILGTINLLNCMQQYKINNLIFSSTAAVYQSSSSLLTEESPTLPLTPYGHSKLMIEQVLRDWSNSSDINCTILRYFNPIGNFKGLEFEGENVIPIVLKSRRQQTNFIIHGNDYDTHDKTAVRDYIAIFDVVDAHVKVLNLKGFNLYNIGTGKGLSVLELINKFNQSFEYGERRKGDAAISVCDASKIKKEVGWEAKQNLDDVINNLIK